MNVIAKSVAVGLLAMAAGSAWASDGTIEFTGEQTDVNLQAYYVSTVESSAITAGEANASVDVTIDYR